MKRHVFNINAKLLFFILVIPLCAICQEGIDTIQWCIQQGRQKAEEHNITEAIDFYKRAIELDPNSCHAYFYLGNIAFQQNDIDAAIVYYQQAAALNTQFSDIECNLGICANARNNTEQAIEHFSKAILIDPSCFLAHTQLALLFEKSGDDDNAMHHLKKAHEIDPYNTDIILYMGNIVQKHEKLEEAVSYYRAAYSIDPDNPKIAIEFANALASINKDEEAIEIYYKVLERNPTFTSTLHNFGLALKRLGYIEQSIEIYKRAIMQRPDYALAHFSLGLAYLSLGDFDHGWLEYEWRWEAYGEKQKEFLQPRWDGSDLRGKRIYVYAEQGLGDTFQFVRYLPILKQQGAHVIFHTQPILKQIFQLCPYIDTLITFRDPLPAFDCHISLLSLPLVCNTQIDTIPSQIPYLYADKTLVSKWYQLLADDKKLYKIGICWQGNARYATAFLRRVVAEKSCNIHHFRMLTSIPDVSIYSLQKIDGTDQVESLGDDTFIHTFDDTFDVTHGRFMDTAAVIKNLDLVISIDTSIAHFAAALGVPTWIILPEPADWRWMQTRTDSPWYPNVRLFRQRVRGDWSGVMDDVMQALRECVSKKRTMYSPITKQVRMCHPSSVEQKLMQYISTLHIDENNKIDCLQALAAAYAIQYDLACF